MNSIGVQPIRIKDEQSRLVAAGVKWLEVRSLVVVPLALLMMCAWLATGFCFIVMLLSGFAWKPVLGFCVGFVSLVALFRVADRIGVRQRSLIFHSDGFIETPDGLPVQPRMTSLAFPSEIISTIEKAEQGRYGGKVPIFFIDVHTHEGDWVSVGHKLTEQTAQKSVVQLTKALAEIRGASKQVETRFVSQEILPRDVLID